MLDQDHDASYPLLFQRCLLIDGTYVAAVTLFLLWMLLVLCTIFMKLKRASLITRIPNTDSLVSEKKRSKALDSSYHPYSRKHSTSFEEEYNADKPTYKYATPIAPHGEKVQLPASYDHVDSHILHTQQVNPPLSRHHPPSTIPGGWVEYTEPMAVSPYHQEDPYQNTWYPNRVV
ncbi:hypothetical protein MFLAVUS_008198 [Mucor flavus]|uniref:Uncharacterized protein n=1 Tax=Mucor flavus TaxID=439312 RepID=A0ABP9Z6G9_9FUNG